MLKIKDYIFNEDEIRQITSHYDTTLELNVLEVRFISDKYQIIYATFEDIEWNYGTPQETQRQIQKELCKSCYYRDTISNKLKELEEEKRNMMLEITKRDEVILDKEKEIAKLEEEISKKHIREVQQKNIEYAGKIKKAIEYIEEHKRNAIDFFGEPPALEELEQIKDLLKILKGEE